MVRLASVAHLLFVLQIEHDAALLQVVHETSQLVHVEQPVHVVHFVKQFCVLRTWGPLGAVVGYKGCPVALKYFTPGAGLTDSFWL